MNQPEAKMGPVNNDDDELELDNLDLLNRPNTKSRITINPYSKSQNHQRFDRTNGNGRILEPISIDEAEECERLKPTNGDHNAYGAAPNDIHPATVSNDLSSDNGKGCQTLPPNVSNNSSKANPNAKRHSLILRRGETDLSIDHSGMQRFLPSFMQFAFADREAEQLYQEYYSNEKRSDFKALIVIVIIVDLVLLLLNMLSTKFETGPHLYVLVICLVSVLVLFALALRQTRDVLAYRLWSAIPYILWFVMVVQLVCDLWIPSMGRGQPNAGSCSFVWLLLYSYATYVIFPLRYRLCAILSLTMASIWLTAIFVLADKGFKFTHQVMVNIILLVTVNLLSTMSFFFYERQQRRAFLETRQSLETKITLEEQSQEQERLLLSVLPKHVAAEIRQDLGAAIEGQFQKIYMRRHENVSILFADIVGFTAFSSTVSAPELVKTLNELFARFDKLSEKYHQLRIKILGDCYYCISGAPEERPDHAVLCVHMGLSMVEAIKYVREQSKSGVDMRVGIHTGGVLAGVLGQRQWQFDVYSRDVEFANKMESGGLPGRVHISERTYSFLNGEFEVTDGDGASREEAIRLAGVKTYLITKVLKPYPEGTLDWNMSDGPPTDDDNGGNVSGRASAIPDELALETEKLSPRSDSVPEYATPIPFNSSDGNVDPEIYKRRLHSELIHRDSQQHITTRTNVVTLSFIDGTLETEYRNSRDTTSCISLLGLPLTLFATTLSFILVGPNRLHIILILALCVLILAVKYFICTIPIVYKSIPKPFSLLSQSVQEKSWIRLIVTGSMITIWILALICINMFYEDSRLENPWLLANLKNESSRLNNINLGARYPTNTFRYRPQSFKLNGPIASIGLPQYVAFFAIIFLLAITALTRINYLMKIGIIAGLVWLQCTLIYLELSFAFTVHIVITRIVSKLDVRLYYTIILVTVLVALIIINRQFELMTRRLFLWQKEVDEQREMVSDMRRKNEALVYNILPPHVAIHFLGKRKNDEELYSRSYEFVGVLFASMPNFSDFYTEESVNNQGLECIRFLNEVISDYDQLLSQPRFADIFKIKTISSTYMAAAGLNDDVAEVAQRADTIKQRWSHLATLTEFALALKETLNFINKESFNNFSLRMGINHGPITAGVIGARKPHYDIWGNTVNVASRMESTGNVGCIQVVEETVNILKEFGYNFEQRGLVSVKGKGKLMTYYLVGKKA